jgi:putative membrane protein
MVSVGLTAYLLPGVEVASLGTVAMVAIVMGIVNSILKPILQLLALPITILTLGLFALVINALMVLLVAEIVPGFQVDGFLVALLFSIVLSIVNSIIGLFIE